MMVGPRPRRRQRHTNAPGEIGSFAPRAFRSRGRSRGFAWIFFPLLFPRGLRPDPIWGAAILKAGVLWARIFTLAALPFQLLYYQRIISTRIERSFRAPVRRLRQSQGRKGRRCGPGTRNGRRPQGPRTVVENRDYLVMLGGDCCEVVSAVCLLDLQTSMADGRVFVAASGVVISARTGHRSWQAPASMVGCPRDTPPKKQGHPTEKAGIPHRKSRDNPPKKQGHLGEK